MSREVHLKKLLVKTAARPDHDSLAMQLFFE